MKNRFSFKHSRSWLITCVVMAVVLVAGVVVNSFTMISYIDAGMGMSMSIAVFALLGAQAVALILFMFNCRYTLTDKCLVIVFALLVKSVPYSHILLLREDKKNDVMLMYYKVVRKGEELVAYQAVNIKASARLDFVEALRRMNSSIVYEDFDIYKGEEF